MDPVPAVPDRRRLTLDRLPVGAEAEVVALLAEPGVRRRLMEMGLVRGRRVRMQRVAPLGDPLALRVLGYQLALRRSEARQVLVELDDD